MPKNVFQLMTNSHQTQRSNVYSNPVVSLPQLYRINTRKITTYLFVHLPSLIFELRRGKREVQGYRMSKPRMLLDLCDRDSLHRIHHQHSRHEILAQERASERGDIIGHLKHTAHNPPSLLNTLVHGSASGADVKQTPINQVCPTGRCTVLQ